MSGKSELQVANLSGVGVVVKNGGLDGDKTGLEQKFSGNKAHFLQSYLMVKRE